jgi:hypothetical protein
MKTTYIAAGVVIGILAVAVAGITFSDNDQVEAQMGMMGHGSMGSDMASGAQAQHGFNASGGSVVDDVAVTGIAVTDGDELTVSLRYSGTGESPGVIVVATTNPMATMQRMHGSMGMSGMQGMGNMMDQGMMGNTTMPMNSTAMPDMALEQQLGGRALDSGWNNGNFRIALEGDGSAYDSGRLMVMVFPLTS